MEHLVQPGPRTHDGLQFGPQPVSEGEKTRDAINAMITDLGQWDSGLGLEDELRRTWHEDMLWWGPAGIGSTYTIERYAKQHSSPFSTDFADRSKNGHLCRVTEGPYGGSYGWASAGRFHHAQSQLKRFLNCIGGFTSSKFTYSFAAAEAMVPHILGSFRAYLDTCTSWEVIRDHTQLFVCFGGVPLKNGQISQGGTGCHIQREALWASGSAGSEIINVSPINSDMLADVDAEWVPMRPNTHVTMMLGLAQTLQIEELTDRASLTT